MVCLGAEAFDGLGGELGDEVKVLVQVKHGSPAHFGRGGVSRSGNGRPAMVPVLGQEALHVDPRSSAAGLRYSTGIAANGAEPKARDSSTLTWREKPASSRVTVLMATSPRSIRSPSSASGLRPRRTNAD